jgi:hypothetical protein
MTCAIVIISHKENLTNLEEIALKQCCNVFRNRTIYLIVPESLGINNYTKISKSFKVIRTKDKNLSTYEAFNKYKISLGLYWKFRRYDYILFYEPDAFVFRDDLDFWMNKNYSLIGAPWLDNENGELKFIGVGNGGFSLRKIKLHILALISFRYIVAPSIIWKEIYALENINFLRKTLSFLKRITFCNNTFFLFNDYSLNEDIFWSTVVPKSNSWFIIPKPEEALSFSFEKFPEELYDINNKALPMGCHAWPKYDIDFWSTFIKYDE